MLILVYFRHEEALEVGDRSRQQECRWIEPRDQREQAPHFEAEVSNTLSAPRKIIDHFKVQAVSRGVQEVQVGVHICICTFIPPFIQAMQAPDAPCFCQLLPGMRLPEGNLRDVRHEDYRNKELQAERDVGSSPWGSLTICLMRRIKSLDRPCFFILVTTRIWNWTQHFVLW